MPASYNRLAIGFFDRRLFYAVAQKGAGGALHRIGSQEFSFPIAEAFRERDFQKLNGIYSAVKHLRTETAANELVVATFPPHECWTTLPKLAQDQPDEREAYLAVLMQGVDRQWIETTWYDLSNRDFRFLLLRDRRIMQCFERFGELVPQTASASDFETGASWHTVSSAASSYLTVGCHPGCLSITSYLLGKMRGTTYFRFEAYEDIPYLWMQAAQHLRWMQGMHEQILIYGHEAAAVRDMLIPVADASAQILLMDSLEKMGVTTDEKTYNFELSLAFPAIMHAIFP